MIRVIYQRHRKRYGSPRIVRELREQGETCSKHRVAKLMKKEGLKAVPRRKFKATTDSKHQLPIASNLLKQQFQTASENEVWLSDITYINTKEGWLYLAAVLDLHSRKVIGWKCSDRLSTAFVSDALAMAYWQRKPQAGVIFHSDRGVQYASDAFRNQLQSYDMRQSMSRKGNCWDNAPMESFFHTFKNEEVHQQQIYQTRKQAEGAVREYVMAYYNSIRKHSALGYLSPMQFEAKNKLAA